MSDKEKAKQHLEDVINNIEVEIERFENLPGREEEIKNLKAQLASSRARLYDLCPEEKPPGYVEPKEVAVSSSVSENVVDATPDDTRPVAPEVTGEVVETVPPTSETQSPPQETVEASNDLVNEIKEGEAEVSQAIAEQEKTEG